jgi:hypothetical protein
VRHFAAGACNVSKQQAFIEHFVCVHACVGKAVIISLSLQEFVLLPA